MRIALLVVASVAFLIGSPQTHAQPAVAKGSLDELIDWNNPWGLTPEKFKAVAEAIPHKKSERAYTSRMSGTKMGLNLGERGEGRVSDRNLSLFEGRLPVEGITAVFEGDKLLSLHFHVGDFTGPRAKSAKPADIALLKAELGKRTGDAAPRRVEVVFGTAAPPADADQWTHQNYRVQVVESKFTDTSKKKPLTVLQVQVLR